MTDERPFELSDPVDARPETTPAFTEREAQAHDRGTRRFLAYIIVGAILAFWGAAVASLLLHWVDKDTFAALTAALTGPTTLAGTVIGFYYAKLDG